MKPLKIFIVTTSRADYGLLTPLLSKLKKTDSFDTHLIATGSHLSPRHGMTIELIKNDGWQVSEKVDMTCESDTEDAVCASIAIGLSKFSKIFLENTPDLLIVLGDRYELWAICMAAVVHKIPIAHIHGGEETKGAFDNAIRHSITKMAAIHFTSIEQYTQRIIQMGENPERVFTVGALGIDNIQGLQLMDIKEASRIMGVDFEAEKIALFTYHPVTLDTYFSAQLQICKVLDALLDSDLTALITMPNADPGGITIYEVINDYVSKYPNRFRFIKNIGQRGYLSAMKFARLMVGNSSSGIIESASFKLPVVNIGDRQSGRLKPGNVIDCACSTEEIRKAIKTALSSDFLRSIQDLKNPYGDGKTAGRIIKILETIDLDNKKDLLKKEFYTIK